MPGDTGVTIACIDSKLFLAMGMILAVICLLKF